MNTSRDSFGVDSMARTSGRKGALPTLTNRYGSSQENLPHPRQAPRGSVSSDGAVVGYDCPLVAPPGGWMDRDGPHDWDRPADEQAGQAGLGRPPYPGATS